MVHRALRIQPVTGTKCIVEISICDYNGNHCWASGAKSRWIQRQLELSIDGARPYLAWFQETLPIQKAQNDPNPFWFKGLPLPVQGLQHTS